MDLHGSIEANLAAALRSARRLRDHPVHADTIAYWTDLILEARRKLSGDASPKQQRLRRLVTDLENELAQRT